MAKPNYRQQKKSKEQAPAAAVAGAEPAAAVDSVPPKLG